MKLLAAGAFLLALHSAAAAAEPPCPRQPMPPAIDSAGALGPRSHVIAFAATPWEYPGRAWVVRVSRRGDVEASLEIVRLLRQSACNRWDVEKRWTGAIAAEEYRSIAGTVEAWGLPPADLVSTDDLSRGGEGLALDGTGLELRLETTGWTVTRTLNHYGRGGAQLSAIFRRLLAGHVPPADLPAEDWRTLQRP